MYEVYRGKQCMEQSEDHEIKAEKLKALLKAGYTVIIDGKKIKKFQNP